MRFLALICAVSSVTVGCRSENASQMTRAADPSRNSSLSVFNAEKIPPVSPNESGHSFPKVKKHLAEIYADRRETFYCGCSFDENGKVDRDRCGYVPASEGARAQRMEWEHVVPAHAFGQSFPSWREGHPQCVTQAGKAFRGRPCARKVDTAYRAMEADMHNLYPVIGELNERRSNYSMGLIPGEPRAFGACDFEVADRKVEPRPEVRGDIARTYLYMDLAYPGRGILSRKNRKLFEAWDEQDPVDRWECERARRIARIQGNVNQVLDLACKNAKL